MKGFAKWISIIIIILTYIDLWGWSIDHIKECNRNAKWEVFVSRLFVFIHIVALVIFCIWGWI